MIGKRFMLDDCGELIDLNNHKFIDYGEECCNLLNEQHETIQRLKQNITELLSVNVEEELLKENEQLRTKNNAYIQDIEVFKEESTHLKLENEQLRHDATILIQSNQDYRKENEQLKQLIKKLEKQIHLIHMASMFSTVKSWKGDVSKRYEYSEETDTIYDTANTYGQYNKILDKKEAVMLLNEYETLLQGDKE